MDRVVGFRKALTQPKFNRSEFYSGDVYDGLRPCGRVRYHECQLNYNAILCQQEISFTTQSKKD